jgi:hypothetical protein
MASRLKFSTNVSACIDQDNSPSRLGAELFPCGVLSQRIWLNAWSRMGERDCWAKRYSEANRDAPAMATGRHRDHVPVSVELGSKCRRDQTDDCNSGQSEGAHTIANHGCPHSEVRAQVKPRRRGDTGASGSVWGEPVMGRETHHLHMLLHPPVLLVQHKMI